MNCHRAQQRFSEYIDEALPLPERAALAEHLAECAECRRELQAWRRSTEALRSLPRYSVPAGFGRRLMDRVLARGAGRPSAPRVIALWPRLAAAAAVLLVVAGAVLVAERGGLFGRRRPIADGDRTSMLTSEADENADAEALGGEKAHEWATKDAGTRGRLEEVAAGPAAAGRDGSRVVTGLLDGETSAADAGVGGSRAKDAPQPRAVGRQGVLGLAGRGEGGREAAEAIAPQTFGATLDKAPGEGVELAEDAAEQLAETVRHGKRFENGTREDLTTEAWWLAAQSPGAVSGTTPPPTRAAVLARGWGADQTLTIVTNDPAVVADRAVRIAVQNGARARQVASAREAGAEPAIVILIDVPGRNYNRLLEQVVEISPPAAQRLDNLRVAAGSLYFMDAADNYERNRVDVLRRQVATQDGTSGRDGGTIALGGVAAETRGAREDVAARENGPGIPPEGAAQPDERDVPQRPEFGREGEAGDRQQRLRPDGVPDEVRLVIHLLRLSDAQVGAPAAAEAAMGGEGEAVRPAEEAGPAEERQQEPR